MNEVERKTWILVRIENRISTLLKRIEDSSGKDLKAWFQEDLDTVLAVRTHLNAGTLGAFMLPHAEVHDQVWEEWMTLRGMAEEI